MTFEGQQMQGSAKIMEKFGSLTFQKIAHLVKLLKYFVSADVRLLRGTKPLDKILRVNFGYAGGDVVNKCLLLVLVIKMSTNIA